MLGVIAAAWLADIEARRRGVDRNIVWDALIWILIGGIIGARLWHVLTPPPSMLVSDPITGQLTNPYFKNGVPQILDIIAIRRGGLGITGAVIGGILAMMIYCWKKGVSFAAWADIAAPALALGQAIGRWGNFVNQELYGKPTNLPWAIKIDNPIGYPPGTTFHPLFLYESLWNLANMFLLLWLERRLKDRLLPGDLFLVYLVGYPIGRFLLEFLRVDASLIAGININQALMIVVAFIAVIWLILKHRFVKKVVPDTNASLNQP